MIAPFCVVMKKKILKKKMGGNGMENIGELKMSPVDRRPVTITLSIMPI